MKGAKSLILRQKKMDFFLRRDLSKNRKILFDKTLNPP
jgi:hypothetical protein